MSKESLKEAPFDQFKFCLDQEEEILKSTVESYSLDLLGFKDEVPMLAKGNIGAFDKEECSGSEQELNTVPINESEPQETENPKENPPSPKPQPINSVLQGKKVIIRTNSMSGQKSLIFKQKTGGNVEIPAKLSSVSSPEITKESSVEVNPSIIPPAVYPLVIRSKPAILKRPQKDVIESAKDFCEAVNNEVENAGIDDVKEEEKDIFSEEVSEETKILPFDHNYFCVSPLDQEIPPLVKISGKRTTPAEEVIEIPEEEEEQKNKTFVIVKKSKNQEVVPIKLMKTADKKLIVNSSEKVRQYSEINFDRFQAEKLEEMNKRSEEKANKVNKQETNLLKPPLNNKKIENHFKKVSPSPPSTNYQLVNTHLTKKPIPPPVKPKNTYFLMIGNKPVIDKTKLDHQPNILKTKPAILKPRQSLPSLKFPLKQQTIENDEVQIVETPPRVFKNAQTNTDDFLLDELIEKKNRERALQNKVTKTTSTEDLLPPPRKTLEDRITITPSPLLLGCDIFDLLEGPNPDNNLDFGIGGQFINNAPSNGKVIENCASLMDISYSRGKNISNGWGGPSEIVSQASNGWLANVAGNNGKPRVEHWKLQLFLDLKHCDQFDSSGNMPLHNAVMQNNVNLVKRHCLALRTRQIDINTLNHSAYTALQLALLHDVSPHIVQLLLQHGADTSVFDPQGNNVLHICVTNSSEAIAKLLLGSTVCADINGINFEGYTPLIMCVLYQKYVQADDLLTTGANPNIADKKSGRTPLFHAVESNDVEMVKLLLNHRALTKVRNFFGTSPHDAMFELDIVDPQIRRLILTKDEPPQSKPELKGRRKKRPNEDSDFAVRSYMSKNSSRVKVRRS